MNNIVDKPLSDLMSFKHLELYNRILAFEIDESGVCFSFSQRLARDNQWSLIYAHEVIEEYKKFLFLAIVAGHPVTPSDAVDQVWHLHLSYTHSYWDDLCTQVLQKPLHHHPTQGGSDQRKLFLNCYSKTLDSYANFFGYPPPSHIWLPLPIRFQQAEHFRRINTQNYWLISKPSLKVSPSAVLKISHLSLLQTIMLALLTLGLVLSLCHPAIAVCSNTIHSFINQLPSVPSIIAQYYDSPQLNGEPPKFPSWDWLRMYILFWVKFLGPILVPLLIVAVVGAVHHFYSSYERKSLNVEASVQVVHNPFRIAKFRTTKFSSRCSDCKRFGIKVTSRVIRQSTPHEEGEELVTAQCSYCNYREQWRASIPKQGSSNDFGCGGCM